MAKQKVFYEYQKITSDDIGERDFKELRSFVLKQEDEGVNNYVPFDELKIEETSACMKLSSDKRGREVLTIKNYVGTIQLSSGTTIEILPKIYQNSEKDNTTQEEKARKIVVEMLKNCGLIKYKSFQSAKLNIASLPIFEVYIRLFLSEVFDLYQKGLKSGYVQKEENEKFFRGKLLFSKHIKYNFSHAERFYIQYDEFNVNRPENRLIKTTLFYLRSITQEENNKREIRRLSMVFDEVDKSESIDADFAKCVGGRNMKEYENVLAMCKVFLKGYSFSSYSGKNNTIALLFPMEKLFEYYVAKKLKEQLKNKKWKVDLQKRGTYLFDTFNSNKKNMFALRPDIFIYNENQEAIILDTKWKVLNDNANENFGISQADMYQMHAYYSRFNNVKGIILLYPAISEKEVNYKWEKIQEKENINAITIKVEEENFAETIEKAINQI